MHYRIKTRKELEEEYGSLDESTPIDAGWDSQMESFLGMPLTEEQYKEAVFKETSRWSKCYLQIGDWAFSLDMIHTGSLLLNGYFTFKKIFGYV